MKKEYLEVGEVVTTHGILGEFHLYPWCDPGDLDGATKLYLENGAHAFEVESVRPHKNIYIVKLRGVETPEDVQKLRGKTLYMLRSEIKMGEGEYFIQDIVGLMVIDADSGKSYGTLKEVAATGANDIYCVCAQDGRETWIPAIRDVVIDTDIEAGKMTIRPLKGLFDED